MCHLLKSRCFEQATWLRVRAVGAETDPSNWLYGERCWFHRTAPKNASTNQGPLGIQQLPFSALADAAPGSNITLVVEAWSDRNDLGNGTTAMLLASSSPLVFTFDDKGFSSKASFVNFTAVESALGSVTIAAQPEDTGFYQYPHTPYNTLVLCNANPPIYPCFLVHLRRCWPE